MHFFSSRSSSRRYPLLPLLAAMAAVGCSGGDGSDESQPRASQWEGFSVLEGLGDACGASFAVDASKHYQPLRMIPCVDGTPNCQEVRWDGIVEWDPGGTGSLLVWEPQFVRDTRGAVTHILLRHRYPRGESYGGTPFEAVLYDAKTDQPVAAWRNTGNTNSYASGGDGSFSSSPESNCEIVPVVAPNRVWLVGYASGSGEVRVAEQAMDRLGEPVTFTPTDINPDTIYGRKVAGDRLLGLEARDGEVYYLSTDMNVVRHYGAEDRIWLHSSMGPRTMMLSSGPERPSTSSYLMTFGDGAVLEILPSARAFAHQWNTMYWVDSAEDGAPQLRVLTSGSDNIPFPEDAAIVPLDPDGQVSRMRVAGDILAIQADTQFGISSSVALFDSEQLTTKGVLELSPHAELLGVEDSHVWVGENRHPGDTAFSRLRRLKP